MDMLNWVVSRTCYLCVSGPVADVIYFVQACTAMEQKELLEELAAQSSVSV